MIIHKRVPKIHGIEQWTDAFMIFMSIYTLNHSDETQHLLKYMSVIRLGALFWKRRMETR